MTKRRYVLALIAVFLLGCAAALGLRAYDTHKDSPQPISDAEVFDFSAGGFTLSAPLGSRLTEYHPADGMLFSGMLSDGDQTLLLFCYANDTGDTIEDFTDQALVTYYTNAGCGDVRMRTLGERRFICYSAKVRTQSEGDQTWYVYETWDEATLLVIETMTSPDDALPILTTLSFAASGVAAQ